MALKERIIEKRLPLQNSFDVLYQHIISCAIGGGFHKNALYEEIITTYAFKDFSYREFENALNFLITGGKALGAYPEYKKIIVENELYQVKDKKLIQFHRINIGTITSDPLVPVKMVNGKILGMVEENFLSSLNPKDHFLFGGRVLELIEYHNLTAYVRISKGEPKTAAVWQGGRLPYSAPLGEVLRRTLDISAAGYPENEFLQQILTVQKKISNVPGEHELLVEIIKSREGWHLFIYPFEGKVVHQALAYLVASRLSKGNKSTFTISANDYGFELLSHDPFDERLINQELFFSKNLVDEIATLININELGRSFFRDIARISGLIFQGYPGRHKSHRQIQMSSGLLYDVFNKPRARSCTTNLMWIGFKWF
jgi:ATP-dependent Lhr-like helicase